jgi:hypothetical protein
MRLTPLSSATVVSATTILAASMSLVACGPATTFRGASVNEYLPLEGDRAWEYIQCDPDDDNCEADAGFDILLVEKSPNTTTSGSAEVVTLDYAVLDPTTLLHSIEWSSDSKNGILIHGWTDAEGERTSYSKPVEMSNYTANKGDVFDSSTDGLSFSSEFYGEEQCPNHWVSEPYKCIHFELTGGDGSEPFLGEWWFAQSWGMVKFHSVESSAPWVLRCAEYGDDDNC